METDGFSNGEKSCLEGGRKRKTDVDCLTAGHFSLFLSFNAFSFFHFFSPKEMKA